MTQHSHHTLGVDYEEMPGDENMDPDPPDSHLFGK